MVNSNPSGFGGLRLTRPAYLELVECFEVHDVQLEFVEGLEIKCASKNHRVGSLLAVQAYSKQAGIFGSAEALNGTHIFERLEVLLAAKVQSKGLLQEI